MNEGDQAYLPTTPRVQQRKNLVDSGDQYRPQVVRLRALGWCRFGRGWDRMAQRCHPRRALARGGWIGLHHDLLGRCSQRHRRSPERRMRSQHTKVAMPVRSRRWHQRRNALCQFPQSSHHALAKPWAKMPHSRYLRGLQAWAAGKPTIARDAAFASKVGMKRSIPFRPLRTKPFDQLSLRRRVTASAANPRPTMASEAGSGSGGGTPQLSPSVCTHISDLETAPLSLAVMVNQ